MTTQQNPDVPVVELRDAAKAYGAVQALAGVSFSVLAGQTMALCGHNGAGKSTLVKLMVGLEQADSGELSIDGTPTRLDGTKEAQRAGLALVAQELSTIPALSVGENLLLGDDGASTWRSRRRERARCRELLARVGLSDVRPERRAASLSFGERQLVEIARALGRDARVLILDEPTATLSQVEIARVFDVLRELAAAGTAIIFVSHRLDEVYDLCEHVTVMRDGGVVARSTTAELSKGRLIELMIGEELAARETTASAPGRPVALRCSVPSQIEDFRLDAHAGTVVGLAGQMGSGASLVLRALGGLEPTAVGELVDGETTPLPRTPQAAVRAGIVYTSYDRKAEGLFLRQPIAWNLTATRLRSLTTGGVLRAAPTRDAEGALTDLVGIDRARLRHPVATLSGGNQQKVLIARSLRRPALRVLLLDEPTRGVDVRGRAEIHRLLRQAAEDGALVVFASTELDELLDLSDVVVTMFAGRVVSAVPRSETNAQRMLAEMTHDTQREVAA